MTKQILLIVFAVGLAAFASARVLPAQTPSPTNSPDLFDHSHVTVEDKDFLITADMNNRTEMALGKLAEKKSHDRNIQEFGQVLSMDHSNNQNQLQELAQKYHVTLPGKLDNDHQKEYDRLSALEGPAFDREFVSQMVLDHQKAIQLFKSMAQRAGDLPVRSYAGDTYPILQKHMDRARELLSSLSSDATPHPTSR